MHKKIITLLIVLIFSLSCLVVVAADNNTTDNATYSEEIEDLMDYIIPISFTDKGIEFSDGFTGFCLDSTKTGVNVDDKFTSTHTQNEEVENNAKWAIIEWYKSGKQDSIEDAVSQAINGNKKYDAANTLFESGDISDDKIVVKIDNTTEATFEFELLKSANDGVSDCLAYKVSMKTVPNDDVLSSSDDDIVNTSEVENDTIIDKTDNATDEKTGEASGGELINDTDKKTDANNDKKSDDETVVNETNKTIVNKTNVVIVNETNTTIIHKNNTKVINKTNETPQNATVQDTIMKTVGNPIFLLAIVIVIIAVVAVVMRRKD